MQKAEVRGGNPDNRFLPQGRMQDQGQYTDKVGDMARVAAKTFQDLLVWQKAHEFVLAVYQFTRSFPKEELYGVTSQFRRSATSIPANIAEGFRKRGRADKGRFMNIAQGSLEESRYYLILARDLEYGDTSKLQVQIEEVSKMLESYARTILNSDS